MSYLPVSLLRGGFFNGRFGLDKRAVLWYTNFIKNLPGGKIVEFYQRLIYS